MKKLLPSLFVGVSLASLGIVVACSSEDPPPPAAQDPSGTVNDAGPRPEASVNTACADSAKNGKETDVDCGGTECTPCIDGKACVANTDCAGGFCDKGLCSTASCTDSDTNGKETDVDCGGDTCAKCNIGKRCKAGTDCVSGTCNVEACACPPGMTTVSRAEGIGSYCIDQVEVTKGQYNKFLNAVTAADPANQVAACPPSANTDFVPRGAWPPAQNPGGLAFNLSLPVHYVDWCDAAAYCKWAGKQLCGQINGGSLAPAAANLADAGAWYNACSAQGTKGWPYSTVFDSTKCNGRESDGGVGSVGTGYGFGGANQDMGVYQTVSGDTNGNFTTFVNTNCQGGALNLFQMSGNVGEWEDSCDGTGTNASCRVRGGSFRAADDPTALSCAATRTEARLPAAVGDPDQDPLRDIGIRCCLY